MSASLFHRFTSQCGRLWMGMLGGAILCAKTQLFYLLSEDWQLPALRLAGAVVVGALIGLFISLYYARLLTRLTSLGQRAAGLTASATLLAVSLLAWFLYDLFMLGYFNWIFALCLLAVVIGLGILAGLFVTNSRNGNGHRLVWLALAAVVVLGLFLRFSGITHGLPDFIAHCDTPKQIELVPGFSKGHFKPPTRYQVGHIYMYTGVLKLFHLTAPALGPVEPLSLRIKSDHASDYILHLRAMQVLLGAAIIWLAFIIGRRLWGPAAGLLAACLVAIDPVHMMYSRQMMGDLPQSFFVLLSLYFSTRILSRPGTASFILAGFFAGAAAATKLYGGYIVVAALAAFLMTAPRRWWNLGVLVPAVVAGIIMFSPYLWVDFGGWWTNVITEIQDQYNMVHEQTRLEGLAYFFSGLAHRFYLPWMILAGLGGVFLVLRRRREDVFFRVPLGLSLLLLIGFRLRYLREWDFVNLTPFLALAMAAMLAAAWQWGTKRAGVAKGAVALGLAVFFVWQGWIALSDAWVARFPDTRQLAAKWMALYMPPGQKVGCRLEFSAFNWLPEHIRDQAEYADVHKRLAAGASPESRSYKGLMAELAWWEPAPPAGRLKPVQIFKVANTYWEHPDIYLYFTDVPDFAPQVILPHNRVLYPSPAFWRTAWAESRPVDFVLDQNFSGSRLPVQTRQILPTAPLDELHYLILGWGQAFLSSGLGLGFPVDGQKGSTVIGSFSPLRSLVPLRPLVYDFSLQAEPTAGWPPLWLGLYQRPELMAPFLLRYAQWEQMASTCGPAVKAGTAMPETHLFYAASLAAQGKSKEAAHVLGLLARRAPQFMVSYRALAGGGDEADEALRRLSSANQELLHGEKVVWQEGSGHWDAMRQEGWPPVGQKSQSDSCTLTLPQSFLPGFFRLEARWIFKGPGPEAPAGLTVLHRGLDSQYHAIAQAQAAPGQSELRLGFEIPNGPPTRLHLRLTSREGTRPCLHYIRLVPDMEQEFAWRYGVFRKYLSGLPGFQQP